LLDLLSSNETLSTGSRCAEEVPFPPNVCDRFVLFTDNPAEIIVGKRHSDTTAYILRIALSDIGRDIPFVHPVQISLLNSEGRVIWENLKFATTEDLLQVKEPIPRTDYSLRLSIDKQEIEFLHLDAYYFRFASLIFFVGVLGGLAVYLFTRRIARPLRDLGKTMTRVSEGAFHARYTPDRMGFEINDLGLQFNETVDALLLQKEEAEKQRILREKLAEELRIGHEIQSNLSPTHIPGLPGIDIATACFPAREVNGDFYDLYHLENGKLLIVICDTAGKGISACLFSLGLRSMIRALASTIDSLEEIVKRANDLYYVDAHERSMFSTVWLGIYDPHSKILTYCNQGHPPALLRRGDEILELSTNGIALGAQKTDVISVKEIALHKKDCIFFYTDGIVEAHNQSNDLFGKERLQQVIVKNQKQTSTEIAEEIIHQVQKFSKDVISHDDMTLIVFHIIS
jgi:sigma-B regulation protein RsbU (phosphoserine phosphatase)